MSIQKQEIQFSADGVKIVGNIMTPADVCSPAPGVLFFHGRASGQEKWVSRAETLSRFGFICMTFDFRGCGGSGGDVQSLTLADGLKDAFLGFDFFSSLRGVDIDRIGIFGSSFGGYLASIVSSKRQIKSLLLHAPAVYRDDWLTKPYPFVEKNREVVTKYRESKEVFMSIGPQSITDFSGSLLIIGGDEDQIVPKNVIAAYDQHAKNTSLKKVMYIKGASHFFDQPDLISELIETSADWFQLHL